MEEADEQIVPEGADPADGDTSATITPEGAGDEGGDEAGPPEGTESLLEGATGGQAIQAEPTESELKADPPGTETLENAMDTKAESTEPVALSREPTPENRLDLSDQPSGSPDGPSPQERSGSEEASGGTESQSDAGDNE